jgi:murein DD-endopeptidase MepM/ murein hydrolase activator NlpD
MLWIEKFQWPLKGNNTLADPYGYTRVIANFTMPHKGADFEAPLGTPVYAMNKGIVRFASALRNYGNTVIIDHGLGVQTIYMHLSNITATLGQKVEKGEYIGDSGDTGYASNPHLHVTVRIWDISIDPIKFMELFGEHN